MRGKNEPPVETIITVAPRYRPFSAPQVGLSGLLACVCRFAEFDGPWISDISGLFIAAHHSILDRCIGGPRIQSKKAPWIGPVHNWVGCSYWHSPRQVCVGIKCCAYSGVGTLVVASVWNAWPHREQLDRPPIVTAKKFKRV